MSVSHASGVLLMQQPKVGKGFLWAQVSGVFREEAAKPETIPCKNPTLAAPIASPSFGERCTLPACEAFAQRGMTWHKEKENDRNSVRQHPTGPGKKMEGSSRVTICGFGSLMSQASAQCVLLLPPPLQFYGFRPTCLSWW